MTEGTDRLDEALPEWTADELALLRSADDDRPRAQSLPAALAAVGIGGAIASAAAGAQGATLAGGAGGAGTAVTASVAAASGKWAGTLAIAKWIALAAVSATVVTGAAVLVQPSATPKRAPAQVSRAPAIAVKPAPPPASAVPPPDHGAETPSAVAEPAPASSRRAKRPSPAQPDISSELAALDAAMKNLRSGHATAALAALDRYDASFAQRGRLHVEATALRIEALARAGQRDKAAVLARELLAEHPKSPYAARVRALLD